MTNVEMSNEFDILFQNITSNQAPGLDEYEKSVFLTKAEKMIVRRQFDPNSDKLREGFDGSQQRQYDFSTLIVTENLKNITTEATDDEKIDTRSAVFIWPSDCFLSVNEVIVDYNNNQYSVNPISYDEYYRQMTKPYQYPPKRIAWRMMTNNRKKTWPTNVFANETYSLPTLGSYVDWINTLSTDSYITKNILSIHFVQGTSDSDNNIILTSPSIIDEDTAEIQLKITALPTSHLYNYNLGEVISLLSEFETASSLSMLYVNWNTTTEKFEVSDTQGSSENYPILTSILEPTITNPIYKAFNGVTNIEFPITLKYIDIYGKNKSSEMVGDFKISTEKVDSTLVEILGRFQSIQGKLSSTNINKYKLRYVKTLSPIVLVDLKDQGLTIDGVDTVTECQLPVECHQEILELAVSLAKIAIVGSTETLASKQADNKE